MTNEEFEFRVWDKNSGVLFIVPLFDNYWGNKNKNDYIVQRFTGLKAKKKYIYEGDILNTKSNRYVVEYDNNRARFIAKGLFYSKPIFNLEVIDGFIIGNIFENPELLKSP